MGFSAIANEIIEKEKENKITKHEIKSKPGIIYLDNIYKESLLYYLNLFINLK